MIVNQTDRPGPPAVPSSGSSPGASQPQPQGGAQPPQPGGGAQQSPPQLAGVPPQFMQRMQSLTSQDAQALVAGVSPPALEILKKLVPELQPIWSAVGAKQGGGGQPGQPGQPQPGGGQQPQPGPGPSDPNGGAQAMQQPLSPGMGQPRTRLADLS